MIFTIKLLLLCVAGVFGKTITSDTNSENEPLNLTPLIEKGQTAEARKLSVVDPGVFAGLHSHAALINVNKTLKWNYFFWFFPAPGKPLETTPWIIWNQGVPGVSSLYGLYEIGPLWLEDKPTKMPITWGSNYSLLFIDSPAGADFSYAEGNNYANNTNQVGVSMLNFLQQFLQVFPELRKAPLFLAGELIAAKYLTALGHNIHHKNDSQPINLRGLIFGGAWFDPASMLHYSEFALQGGLIDRIIAFYIKQYENVAEKACKEGDARTCGLNISRIWQMLALYSMADETNYLEQSNIQLGNTDLFHFMNRKAVRTALHMGDLKFYNFNAYLYNSMWDDVFSSVKPYLEELLEHYGVMCYNGQLETTAAYPVSVHAYRSLNWSDAQAYHRAKREPIHTKLRSGPIGYVKGAGNFMEIMVRDAGRYVPQDQPKAALYIIDMFIEKFAK